MLEKEMDVHVAAFHSLPATSAASPAAATAATTTAATAAAAAAAAAAFPANAPPAVGGWRATRMDTDMDEEHWARAYAGDFEKEQGLEGRGGFGMMGDVGNVGTRGGNFEGGLERRDGADGASGVTGPVSGRSLNVGCPICGVMVHSERDLNMGRRREGEEREGEGVSGGRLGRGRERGIEGGVEERGKLTPALPHATILHEPPPAPCNPSAPTTPTDLSL
ncbi:unnamed protein product [Closterium sp. NIES-64]|nr:unnamed protein product [Closterium sp. NIES-64]